MIGPWNADVRACSCELEYTDLQNRVTPASGPHNKPEQKYDTSGHYICSGCGKDYSFLDRDDAPPGRGFNSQAARPRLSLGTITEKHGWAFHCLHGVDVCMKCASDPAKVPGHVIVGVPPGTKVIDRVTANRKVWGVKRRKR